MLQGGATKTLRQAVNLPAPVYASLNRKSRRSGRAAFPFFLMIKHYKEKRDDLPVIAQNYLLGNVTETSLTGNLTHVRDKVKEFKEESTYKPATKTKSKPSAAGSIWKGGAAE